jgi:hypothetical protein
MNKFGQIKSNIESLMTESYGKSSFKNHMKSFKKNILENKRIAEAYFLYDELSKNKGLSKDIVDDYVNESIETIKNIVSSNTKKIKEINMWVSENVKTQSENNYKDIDSVVYNSSVKNLEQVLESKNRIKNTISKQEVAKTVSESVNIPLSSMLKIATNTFNREFGNISEEEKQELKTLLSLDKKSLTEEIEKSKLVVIEKLNTKLNESTDDELTEKVEKTIEKINESEVSLVSLYKLRQLEQGL